MSIILSAREDCDHRVELVYDGDTSLSIRVYEKATDEVHESIIPNSNGLDAFNHPYVYLNS